MAFNLDAIKQKLFKKGTPAATADAIVPAENEQQQQPKAAASSTPKKKSSVGA